MNSFAKSGYHLREFSVQIQKLNSMHLPDEFNRHCSFGAAGAIQAAPAARDGALRPRLLGRRGGVLVRLGGMRGPCRPRCLRSRRATLHHSCGCFEATVAFCFHPLLNAFDICHHLSYAMILFSRNDVTTLVVYYTACRVETWGTTCMSNGQ